MDAFSVASLTSSCSSMINRTVSSTTELDVLIPSASPGAEVAILRTHCDLLKKLSHETRQLEELLSACTSISQGLQGALNSLLSTGVAATGKLHKQLMRLDPQNVHDLDDGYIQKFDGFLGVYAQAFSFMCDILSISKHTEQDARLVSSTGQETMQAAEKAFNNTTQAVSVFSGRYGTTNGAKINSLPQKSGSATEDPADQDDEHPPAYEEGAHGSSPREAEAGPSEGGGAFASFAKSFRAFTFHITSKPDPFVSALCRAVANGDIKQVKGLVAQGASVSGRDEHGNTPMYYAIDTDNEETFRLLLAAGASAKGSSWISVPPLFQAAASGKLRIAKALLENGADINEKSMTGQPYFIDVCSSGNLTGVEFLLQNGASPLSETVAGRPALVQAVKKGQVDLAKLLIKHGAKTSASDITGSTVLSIAASKKDLTMARLLLDRGADANSGNIYGNCVISEAVSSGNLEAAKLLLDHGAKGDVSDHYGNSVLINALKSSKFQGDEKTELVRRLLQNGARASSEDTSWSGSHGAALCYALESSTSSAAIVELLLQHGANPNKCEMSTGEPLLLYAMDKGKTEETRALLQRGANPNATDKNGRAPLMQALVRRDLDMIKLLRRHRADVNVMATVSVADVARLMNDPEIFSLLDLKPCK